MKIIELGITLYVLARVTSRYFDFYCIANNVICYCQLSRIGISIEIDQIWSESVSVSKYLFPWYQYRNRPRHG